MVNDSSLPVAEDRNHDKLFTPAGDKPLEKNDSTTTTENTTTPAAEPTTAPTTYSQDDIDYAVASRYVELENEYLKKDKLTKNAAKEIAYVVMDDFELTQQEWEDFLQRATEKNLFEKVRNDVEITHQNSESK